MESSRMRAWMACRDEGAGIGVVPGRSLQAVEQIPDPSQVDALRFVVKDPLEIWLGPLGVADLQIEEGTVQAILG